MEALTAAAVAGLTLIDMIKGVERGVYLESVRLLEKSGGRSGTGNESARPESSEQAHVITISDGAFHRTREDKSGPALVSLLHGGFRVSAPEVVADESNGSLRL